MLLLSPAAAWAQQEEDDTLPAVWDLHSCIDYATRNNITIRQSRLETESTEVDLKTAKAALFPSVFFSTGHSLINRPFQDSGTTVSGTEIISSDAGTSYTGNYGLDASWTLYNGGENRKNIRLLELEGGTTMELAMPEISDEEVLSIVPDKAAVYSTAVESRPEIRSGKLDVDASGLNIGIARAGYLPSLTLSAGIGTSHTFGTDYTFTEQIKNGWNNSIGLTLSIPITSNRQNRSAVEKARIQNSISKLELSQACKDLYKKFESLWLDATSAQQQFIAARDQEESAAASYELASEQFSLGMKNTVELLTEKNDLSNARQETLQAKYMAILNIQLLQQHLVLHIGKRHHL